MDSNDRPLPSVPAIPTRSSTAIRPMVSDAVLARAGGAEPAGSVNMLRVAIRAVTRHWWQLLMLWAIATGGLVYLINANVKPMYEAKSLLRVEPSHGDIFGAGGVGENIDPYLETQVQLITSPNVMAHALTDPKASALEMIRTSKDPESDLRRKLMVALIPKTWLIQVTMTSESSTEVVVAVNAVVDAYLKTNAEYSDGTTRAQIKNLENYQRELQNQVDEKQEQWLMLAGKGNVEMLPVDPGTQTGPQSNTLPVAKKSQLSLEEYKHVRADLNTVNLELATAEAVLSTREAEARGVETEPRANLRIDTAFYNLPETKVLGEQIEKARGNYESVSKLNRNQSDPSVTAALRKLNALTAKWEALFQEKREILLGQLQEPGTKTPDAALATARENVIGLKARKMGLEKAISEIEVKNTQSETDAVKIAIVRDVLSDLKDMQQSVFKRLEQHRYESKGEARINRINEARENKIPVSDNRVKYMTLTPGCVLGVLLALFVLLELKIGRVSDLEDLAKQLPVEVFAVPPLPGPRLEAGQRGAREREARLQEFLQTLDHLRVSLCGEDATAGIGRCLMITSATAGEGKTTLTAQLAACCAKAGVTTLVIDADLRRATLSRILNEENTPGLSDVLQGNLDPDSAPVALPDAGFHFLPAGSAGRDPSWLLKNQRIGQLLTRYRQIFDLVLIDTPPVLPVPDALTIGRWTDGTVLTTRFDVSRFPLVDRARKRISSAGIPLLKTVVNGVRTSRFYYGYGYGSGYSYGYGYGGAYGGYGAYGDRSRQSADQSPTSTA
jgi:polysaccharide biosynthesis transport protein